MNLTNTVTNVESGREETTLDNSASIDASKIDNSVLQRLIEEVKSESQNRNNISAYNRLHNRHNRSR